MEQKDLWRYKKVVWLANNREECPIDMFGRERFEKWLVRWLDGWMVEIRSDRLVNYWSMVCSQDKDKLNKCKKSSFIFLDFSIAFLKIFNMTIF